MMRIPALLLQATLAVVLIVVSAAFALVGLYGIWRGNANGWFPLVFFGGIAAFFVFECLNRLKSRRERPWEMGEAEQAAFNKQVARDERKTEKLIEGFAAPSIDGEPLPPWLEVPGACPFHMIWRMGAEAYLRDEFGPYFAELDACQRKDYFARYGLGEEWPHRSLWRRALQSWDDEI